MANKLTSTEKNYIISRLELIPDIPNNPDYWGKEYTNTCKCGGLLHAIRSTYNGHISVYCDNCDFKMME